MKAVIIIPTYNERENVQKLIPELITSVEAGYSGDFEVLIVDGNSPDGTGEVIQNFSKQYKNVHLLLEPEKRGLGAAYVYGFKHAMSEMGADIIVEMDADFQHNPQMVPVLLNEIEMGADYVVGSRFVKGGSIPKEWSLKRKFLSIGGNIFSKLVLGILNVNDFTSGFKASRVKGFVDQLDLDNVLSQGFAYKIDLLFRMHRLGAKIKEVPINFALRDRGDSKMEKNNMLDSLRVVFALRMRELERFIKFGLVGFLGFFSDIGLFNLFLWATSLGETRSSSLSGFIAINVTYLFNNFWSFNKQKISDPIKILKKAPVYYVISYIPIYFRSSVLIPLALKTFGDSPFVSNTAFIMGVAVGLVWNFFFYSKIVWKNHD
ncbi:MAG TPA: glycosyltransferase family 2 protein [bacterium]|nr:glycosyltransferase family 2 protein [bacterium]